MVQPKPPIRFKRIDDRKITLYHIVADIIALILCHIIFLGKYRLPYSAIFSPFLPVQLQSFSVVIAISTVIVIWLLAFYLSGHYTLPSRKSGLQIIGPTLATSFLMSILLFFILVSYAPIVLKANALLLSFRYLLVVFTLTFTFRMIIIARLHHLINIGRYGYKKVLVGNNDQALKIVQDHRKKPDIIQEYIGYLDDTDTTGHDLSRFLPRLGTIDQIETLINKTNVDVAIVCLNPLNHKAISKVINHLRQNEILIRLSTDINTIIEGTVKTQSLESLPFITISTYKLPVWQRLFKRTFDLTAAWAGLILSSPISIVLAIGVKASSKGPIFYKQMRIGRHRRPFMMFKFRSMYVDAEKNGPELSSTNDPRITPLGRFMRKWRLDELPQFINIILGDMSFVGPRPERKYFIDKILPLAPHYAHLFTVRPGITSWGMVKYGYAENIEQMIERLQYDILYLENRTLVVDFKILLFTIKTLLKGEGK